MSRIFKADTELFLRILARHNPHIWEVIGGGPQGPGGFKHVAGPHPEPWSAKEIGAQVFNGLAMRAVLTHDFERLTDDLLDWCPTHPRIVDILFPKDVDEPVPHPNWEQFLGAAVAAVELAHGLEGEEAEQLQKAAGHLFEMSQKA
jgi:hypothetical protein